MSYSKKLILTLAVLGIVSCDSDWTYQNRYGAPGEASKRENRVTGLNNRLDGFDNDVNGADNDIFGNVNRLTGSTNNIKGNGNKITGNGNMVDKKSAPSTSYFSESAPQQTKTYSISVKSYNDKIGPIPPVSTIKQVTHVPLNTIEGLNNRIDGRNNFVRGDQNGIKGDQNQLVGHYNNLVGNSNNVSGSKNKITGQGNIVKSRY